MSDLETPKVAARPERKATLRLSQRELSRISLAVVLVIVAALGLAGYRVFVNFKSQRDIVIGKSNLLAIYKALRGYSLDYEGRLPPAETWTDVALGYLSASPGTPGGKEGLLHGPGDGETIGYVYNDQAAGYNLETGKDADGNLLDPSRVVLLIERPGAQANTHVKIPPQGSAQGEQALFKELAFPHYEDDTRNATTVILFANGNIVTRTRRDFAQSGDGGQE